MGDNTGHWNYINMGIINKIFCYLYNLFSFKRYMYILKSKAYKLYMIIFLKLQIFPKTSIIQF